MIPNFPDICCNPYYKFGRSFPYARAHHHLMKISDLISAHASSVCTAWSSDDTIGDKKEQETIAYSPGIGSASPSTFRPRSTSENEQSNHRPDDNAGPTELRRQKHRISRSMTQTINLASIWRR